MNLKRTLGLRNAVMLVVGNVVGAGIFTTSGFLAGEVGTPAIFLGVWLVGGLLTICGALTYAELGAMFPRAGGDYQFLKEAYGSAAGFLVGWLAFWVITPGSIAALSIALAGHLPGISATPWAVKLIAAAVIAAISLLNLRGARLAGNTQDLVTLGSVLLLVGLVVGGLLFGAGDSANFTRPSAGDAAPLITGSAMIAVIFTYSGWFASSYVGSEVVRPERNVPRSLIVGTLIVTLLYLGVNAIYLYGAPLPELEGAENVAALVARRLFSGPATIAISLAIVLAIASCINATVMTGARICYAMARDGVFFSRLGSVHPRYGTPDTALIVQAAVATALVLLGTFDQLLTYVVVAMLLASIATGLALFVLRARRPDAERPYRTLGYPVVPAVFVLAYLAIAGSICWNDPVTALIGLGIVATGVPFFLIWRRVKAPTPSPPTAPR